MWKYFHFVKCLSREFGRVIIDRLFKMKKNGKRLEEPAVGVVNLEESRKARGNLRLAGWF